MPHAPSVVRGVAARIAEWRLRPCRQLFVFALLAAEVIEAVRAEVAVIRPPAWNRFPHAFSHIFAGGYA